MSEQSTFTSTHGHLIENLATALETTDLEVTRRSNGLLVRTAELITQVETVQPTVPNSGDARIATVITLRTCLPEEMWRYLEKPALVTSINRLASLSALGRDDHGFFIGSRLTVFEGDEAESVHFPLLLLAIFTGYDALFGNLQSMSPVSAGSAWGAEDFELIRSRLSRIAYTTAAHAGLTAEFPLKQSSLSAAAGDSETALSQLQTNQSHPRLGEGLLCTLQMPQRIPDQRLDGVVESLNRMEMAPHDLPPHFGAWTRGNLANNPAYVSFLPNALHAVYGIALNQSIWAFSRAQWADAMLKAMGI